jgi:taurine dioxygenase
MPFAVRPLSTTVGAEVSDINLNSDLTPTDLDHLYAALAEHKVLFFRNQKLSAPAQAAFGAAFGILEPPHPIYPHVEGTPEVTVLETSHERPADSNEWHTDLTWRPRPPFASVLYCVARPHIGGDTLWSDMCSAYEALPEAIKALVANLRCVHDLASFRNEYTVGEKDGRATKLEANQTKFSSTIWPMVMTHPANGRKFLYCNPGFVNQVVGMRSQESRRLLAYLWDHMSSPDFQVRFQWEVGSVVIWDNRCTMHYGPCEFSGGKRIMHRVTIANDRRASSTSCASHACSTSRCSTAGIQAKL